MKTLINNIFLIFCFLFHSLLAQFNFAWITDTHIGSPDSEKDLLQIVNDINKQNIKFIIITGDVTEKGLNSELIQAKEILDKLNRPYFIIPGNHDTKWSESGCTKFDELFGDNRFFLSFDDYCFIGLNSGIPLRGGGGHISPEDINWLKNRLDKLSSDTKIVFAVHHQLDKEIDNYKDVVNLFTRFEKVFVIFGHGHANRSYIFDGINGAMGRSALSKGKTPGYNLVSLFGDSISIRTIDLIENKEWYRNSIKKIKSLNEENLLNQKLLKQITPIFKTNTTVVKTGLLINDKLFFADLKGYVYSIKLNGKLNWKKYFSTSFFAKPLFYETKIILAGTNGKVYFLNQINGKLIKTIQLTASIIASPIINKNFLILFSNDGKINFISLKNYKFYSYKVAEKNFESIPLLYKNKIIIGNWDSFLYSFNLNPYDSLIINWKWSENKNFYYSPAACSPVVDKSGRIFISTPDKFVSSIDSKTGKTLFRSDEFNSWESIGIDESKEILLIKGLIDTLYAVQVSDSYPVLKWKTYLGNGLDTNPVSISVKKPLVVVPAKNGCLYVLDLITGKLLRSVFLSTARLNDVIFIDNKNLIISNMDGEFFKIVIN